MKLKLHYTFLLVFIFFSASSMRLHATNYYCSPTGTGNGTSYKTPFSFSTGVSKITAGDTLFCLGGQYNLTSTVKIKKSGTASKYIVIINYPGEKPILDFRKQAYGQRGVQIDANYNYIHIKGLTIRYTGKNGLHNSGSHCIFEQLDVYGNGDSGIQMKAGGDNLILNCDSHDNFDYKLENDFGGNADGFADKQYTGGSNTYRGCRAWNNSDDGWDYYQRVSQTGTLNTMEDCICYHNGPAEYDMRNHARYNTDKSWFDQFAGEGKDVTFRSGVTKRVTLEHYYNNGNANGFKLGGKETIHHVKLTNCLAVGNLGKGFDQNSNFGDMTIYNGSAYANMRDYGFYNTGGGKLLIRNCVSFNSQTANTFNCKTNDVANNSWDMAGVTCKADDFMSLDTTLICAPRQADGNLPVNAFMRLTEKSNLIDKGVDVGLPFIGKAPDLGCYEYNSASPSGIATPRIVSQNDEKMYNLQGQCVTDSFRGIVVCNNKKYIKR